jgi:D-glycero-D-manno-heptose 1,7-bisphosphate phosphatase
VRRAVFVDRDGVICRNRTDHVKCWEEFVFLPGAVEALVRLASLHLPIIVITNQAAINRGIVPVEVVEDINARMVQVVEAAGGRIDDVMYCPHRPDEQCDCRKPRPGMLLMAAEKWGVNLSQSYLIGDAETDMQAARAVGCHRYLVLTGRGWRHLIRCLIHGKLDYAVKPTLGAAVNGILRRERSARRKRPRVVLGRGSDR